MCIILNTLGYGWRIDVVACLKIYRDCEFLTGMNHQSLGELAAGEYVATYC